MTPLWNSSENSSVLVTLPVPKVTAFSRPNQIMNEEQLAKPVLCIAGTGSFYSCLQYHFHYSQCNYVMSFWYRLRTESKKNLEIDVFIVQEGLYGVYADVAYYRQIIDFHINPEAG